LVLCGRCESAGGGAMQYDAIPHLSSLYESGGIVCERTPPGQTVLIFLGELFLFAGKRKTLGRHQRRIKKEQGAANLCNKI